MEHSPSPQAPKETIEKGQKKENPLINLGCNLIIPTVIMMKFSGDQHLGQVYGLIVALAFPLLYGLYDLLGAGKVNVFSLLGLLSILLTGGIGLMELDKTWMVIKETSFPLVLGIFVFISERTKKPLIRQILNQVIDLEKVQSVYEEHGIGERFRARLKKSSYMLGGTFFISALLNFLLAVFVLEGKPGTEEFVESLGKMTGLSFPVIALPMMIMVALILVSLFNNIKKETNEDIENFFRQN